MFCKIILFAGCLMLSIYSRAQTKWTLPMCIDYAIKNNISIKEADVQKRLADLNLLQNKAAAWPTLSLSGSSGYRFGLSENPTTGILQSNSFFSTGFSVSANVTVFNWFSRQHTLTSFQLMNEAQKLAVIKARNDVKLNISAAYLQALLAKKMEAAALLQVKQTLAQAEVVQRKIKMGILSELDAAQVEVQLMNDSAALLESRENCIKALFGLKAILNLDAGLPVDIELVNVTNNSLELVLQLQPDALTLSAMENLPQIKSLQHHEEAAKERMKAAQATRYPVISLYGSAASNFVNIPSAQSYVFVPQQATGSKVEVNGVSYDVMSSSYRAETFGVTPFFRQMQKNFGQNIGVSISMPILNGRTHISNKKREELSLAQLNLQKERVQQDIKTAIHTAFLETKTAYQKVRMLTKSVDAGRKTVEAARKRYGVNLLSTQDLLLTQTSLQKAEIELLVAQYDLLFKTYLLEFYQTAGK